MYGSYGYGYSTMANTVGVGLVLGFIAFVAAIVVTVLFYKKFIAVDNIHKSPGLKRDWGPFFRFEHLIIENILKVLYIFAACLIAFECAASIITSLFTIMYDPGAAFAGILIMLIVCIVLEVLNRLWFEFALLTVLIWKNTSAIRKSVSGQQDDTQTGSFIHSSSSPYAPQGGYSVPTVHNAQQQTSTPTQSFNSSAQQSTAPVTGSTPSVPQPVSPTTSSSAQASVTQPQSASQDTFNGTSAPQNPPVASSHSHNEAWTCPSCGAFNKSGSFCAQCGTRRG